MQKRKLATKNEKRKETANSQKKRDTATTEQLIKTSKPQKKTATILMILIVTDVKFEEKKPVGPTLTEVSPGIFANANNWQNRHLEKYLQ